MRNGKCSTVSSVRSLCLRFVQGQSACLSLNLPKDEDPALMDRFDGTYGFLVFDTMSRNF
jgi:hypothetical protein